MGFTPRGRQMAIALAPHGIGVVSIAPGFIATEMTDETARRLKMDVEEFRKGLGVELEHGLHGSATNVTDDDPIVTGKIALAHLNEFPDYYTRLATMEAEAEEHWSGGPAPDRRVVAERCGTSESTVYLVAKAFTRHAGRVDQVITRKKRVTPPVEPKVTGDVEARVIALACSQPPAGRARWTLRLLERQVALTEGIPPMDHSTIGRVLKRGRLSLT
mgnify:CR=1 FL=1